MDAAERVADLVRKLKEEDTQKVLVVVLRLLQKQDK